MNEVCSKRLALTDKEISICKEVAMKMANRGRDNYTDIAASISVAYSNLVIIELLERLLEQTMNKPNCDKP